MKKWPLYRIRVKVSIEMEKSLYNLLPMALRIKLNYQYIRDICTRVSVAALFIVENKKTLKGNKE